MANRPAFVHPATDRYSGDRAPGRRRIGKSALG